jgi:hypothetical protein
VKIVGVQGAVDNLLNRHFFRADVFFPLSPR